VTDCFNCFNTHLTSRLRRRRTPPPTGADASLAANQSRATMHRQSFPHLCEVLFISAEADKPAQCSLQPPSDDPAMSDLAVSIGFNRSMAWESITTLSTSTRAGGGGIQAIFISGLWLASHGSPTAARRSRPKTGEAESGGKRSNKRSSVRRVRMFHRQSATFLRDDCRPRQPTTYISGC